MKIGFFNYYEMFNNNRMFRDPSAPIGDDLAYPTVYLSEFAKERNISVSTIDTEPLKSYDAIVFMEFPGLENIYFKELIADKFENLYLLLHETEIIRPDNWDRENHKYFKKIFSWRNDLVDGNKYIKYCMPNKIPKDIDFDLTKKTSFCTMIAGHKFVNHPLEIYSKRVEAVRWFEQNHPEDFDLYGVGWNEYRFKGIFSRLNDYKKLAGFFKTNYPSYRGPIKSKRDILQRYKFSICYENARDIAGYITEKIFDCFFAGCVPIYWGAPNISEQIPEDTFIDKRKFPTYNKLYSYLKNMPDKEYINYIDAIKKYLKSDNIYPFSAESFAETIIDQICKDVSNKNGSVYPEDLP